VYYWSESETKQKQKQKQNIVRSMHRWKRSKLEAFLFADLVCWALLSFGVLFLFYVFSPGSRGLLLLLLVVVVAYFIHTLLGLFFLLAGPAVV